MSDWFEAEQRAERAQRLAEAQRWDEALHELEAAISINPHIAEWHAHRGYLLDELERYKEAVEAYEHSLQLEPDNPELLHMLGVELGRLGQFDRALRVFSRLAQVDSSFEPAYCHRIAIYAEQGEHEKAEEMFYLAQQLNESCPHCFYHIGCSLAERGDFDRALHCWQRVLELAPDYLGVNQRIAGLYRNMEKPAEARESLLAELRNDPGNTDLHMELAELSLDAGDIDGAASKFAQIIELEPDHEAAHLAMGRLLLRQGKLEEALRILNATVDMGGETQPEAMLRMGETLLLLGRAEEAHATLSLLEETEARDIRLLMLLGHCCLALRRPEESAHWYRSAVRVDARNPLAQFNLGVCLVFLLQVREGLGHLLRAVELKPDFMAAIERAAVAHVGLGQFREARGLVRQGLALEQSPVLMRISRRMWFYRIRYATRRLAGVFRGRNA